MCELLAASLNYKDGDCVKQIRPVRDGEQSSSDGNITSRVNFRGWAMLIFESCFEVRDFRVDS